MLGCGVWGVGCVLFEVAGLDGVSMCFILGVDVAIPVGALDRVSRHAYQTTLDSGAC